MFSGVDFRTFAGISSIPQLVFGFRPDIISFNFCGLVGLIYSESEVVEGGMFCDYEKL